VSATLALLRFEVVRTSRSRRYLFFSFGFPVLFYLVFSHTGAGAHVRLIGLAWPLYFMVSMMAYGVLGAGMNAGGIRLAAERTSGWTRQLRITPLPPFAYVLGKICLGLILTLPVMAIITVLAVVVGHVSLSFVDWLKVMAALLVAAIPFAVLGVLLGYLMTSDTGGPLTGGLLFLLAYFGGLFQPVQSMPSGLKTIAYLTPTYHLAGVGWWALGGRTQVLPDVAVLAAYLVAFAALAVWRVRVDEARPGA